MRNPILPVLFAVLLSPVRAVAVSVPAMPTPATGGNPAAVQEPAPLAVIHEVVGQAFITKAGDPAPSPAEEDMDLGPGDRIATGANGRVTISLRDEHFVRMDGLATLTIKDLRSDQVAGGIWARLLLARGKLMAVVASLTSVDSRFEVDTPSAVAAVKGTTFEVSAGGKSTTISVLEGSVAASGFREDAVAPEELEVKEGFETVVDGNTRRPGPLTKLFKNEKRKKFRIALSEFRAKMVRLRARGQSGELRRERRLRVLSRAMLIQRFQQKNPQAYQALPEWKRTRLDQFLAGHQPGLAASRSEVSRFLNGNPKTRKLLEQQASRRFAAPRIGTSHKSGTRTPTAGKSPSRGRQKAIKPVRQ